MIVGLDFDGTLAAHEYPGIGEDLGARPWLHMLARLGCEFILFTMRDGPELAAAVNYCRDRLDIDLHGVNVNPTQWRWTMSPKAYCHLYIDDNALGVPLRHDFEKPAVDWSKAGPLAIDFHREWRARHGSGYIASRDRYAGGGE